MRVNRAMQSTWKKKIFATLWREKIFEIESKNSFARLVDKMAF